MFLAKNPFILFDKKHVFYDSLENQPIMGMKQ